MKMFLHEVHCSDFASRMLHVLLFLILRCAVIRCVLSSVSAPDISLFFCILSR